MDSEIFYKEFGRMVKRHRKAVGLKQGALAERVGLSRTSVTNIEVGRQKIPLHFLYALASSLGVEPAQLLPNKEDLLGTDSSAESLSELLKDNIELNNDGQDWVTRVIKPNLTDNVGGDKNATKKGGEGG